MRLLKFWGLVSGLIIISCNQTIATIESDVKPLKIVGESNDKIEIRNLIRQVLNWSNSDKTISLLPLLEDKKSRFYTGVDFVKHNKDLQKLNATDLFTAEFINEAV